MAHEDKIIKSWLFFMRLRVGEILNQYWETWEGLLTALSPVTASICSVLVK